MERYDEARFQQAVEAAMRQIRTLLDHTRNPQRPTDVPHRYDDKYTLAEILARTSIAALLQCLGSIGLSDEGLAQLLDWARTRSVTLRFKAQETCKFLREEVRQVESAQQHVVEKRTRWGGTETTTEKIVTTVREYFWSFEFSYELVAFQGNMPEKTVKLHGRTGRVELKTAARTTPRPEEAIRPCLDANITWLLGQIDGAHRASFSIDRAAPTCHTPRRNEPVDAALRCFQELASWCARVHGYFVHEIFSLQADHGRDLSAIHARDVFVPVVPVFEASGSTEESVGERSAGYAATFLAEQQRSLAARRAQLAQLFPRDASLVTVADATLLVTLLHAIDICNRFSDGVDHIEAMLQQQLIAAIGKVLSPGDFAAYIEFHQRKIFQPAFQPRPFSHAIRRPEHSPEGVLSIEASHNDATPAPIFTTCASREARRPMYFSLDAATRVSFLGERHLHAWVAHQFSGRSRLSLQLVARARQFSSFLLLVGRIVSADTFAPCHAILLQNKDVLKIPLLLEQIPTPKEFRDAIESLSPEQQRFARAFRDMQLESTLFGVCIVQIKPQLEALLNLPPDSLTKEIKLTQELLSLFIEYQIPSDLISYDGPADAPAEHKLARVTEHVSRMQAMIQLSKNREIEEAQERERLRLAEANKTPFFPPEDDRPMLRSADEGMVMRTIAMAPRMFAPTGAPMPSMSAPMPPPSPGALSPKMAPPPAPAPARPQGPPPAPMAPAPATVAAPAQVAPPEPRRPVVFGTIQPATEPQDGIVDYTRVPADLDKKFEQFDHDSALRPTVINPGDPWTRTYQKGLLSEPTTATLQAREQETERNKAFDLLDALSRSGALPLEHASLHVLMASTHCFDKTLLDTVIQDNVNPIEKVERSLMLVATTIHDQPATALLAPIQRERFLGAHPDLGPPALPPETQE
jgi:hypothetical protein